MINHEEDETKKEMFAKYASLFNSLDKKAKKIVQELAVIQCLIDNTLMHDINCALGELLKQNCNKAIISLIGETATGEVIKSKEEIIVHM
jgi:hypothetical protein